MNLTETEKAYLAGIFDGEGSIGLYFCRGHITPKVNFTISNTDFRLATWIETKIPWAKIRTRTRNGSFGKKSLWAWTIKNRKELRLILEIIYPYLVIKVDQVKVLLSLMDDEGRELEGKFRNKKPSPNLLERQTITVAQLKAMKIVSTQFVQ